MTVIYPGATISVCARGPLIACRPAITPALHASARLLSLCAASYALSLSLALDLLHVCGYILAETREIVDFANASRLLFLPAARA